MTEPEVLRLAIPAPLATPIMLLIIDTSLIMVQLLMQFSIKTQHWLYTTIPPLNFSNVAVF